MGAALNHDRYSPYTLIRLVFNLPDINYVILFPVQGTYLVAPGVGLRQIAKYYGLLKQIHGRNYYWRLIEILLLGFEGICDMDSRRKKLIQNGSIVFPVSVMVLLLV